MQTPLSARPKKNIFPKATFVTWYASNKSSSAVRFQWSLDKNKSSASRWTYPSTLIRNSPLCSNKLTSMLLFTKHDELALVLDRLATRRWESSWAWLNDNLPGPVLCQSLGSLLVPTRVV